MSLPKLIQITGHMATHTMLFSDGQEVSFADSVFCSCDPAFGVCSCNSVFSAEDYEVDSVWPSTLGDICGDTDLEIQEPAPLELPSLTRMSPTWEPMAEGTVYLDVPIFGPRAVEDLECGVARRSMFMSRHEEECKNILCTSFEMCLSNQMTSANLSIHEVIEEIKLKSNYEVLEISRIQNRPRALMHKAFRDSYSITNAQIVYHGGIIVSNLFLITRSQINM